MASGSDLAVQLIVAIGGTTAASTVVGALVSRRKTKAEVSKTEAEADGVTATTAKTIAEAAGMMLQPLQTQIMSMSEQIIELQRKAHVTDEMLTAHVAWDRKVTASLQGAGIPVEPPPPLRLGDV